jgi:hypothetical protein
MIALYTRASLPEALALIPAVGVPAVVAGVAAQTLLQRATPAAYRGRVFGALGTANALVGVVAVGLAGALAGPVGTVGMLVAAGSITALAGLLGLALLPGGRRGRGVEAGGAAAAAAD